MTSDLDRLATPQRQSRWAVAFLALTTLRRVGIAQLVVLFVFLGRLPLTAIVVVVPSAGVVLLAIGFTGWRRFTFMIADGELRVTKGIVSDERLSVPLDRVQSVSLEQRFLHRLIGLVEVSVDTAGADEPELTIDSVDREVARALQRVTAEHRTLVSPAKGGPSPLPPPELTVVRRDVNRLLRAGIARPAFGGLALLLPLVAVGEEVAGIVAIDAPDVDTDGIRQALIWLIPLSVVVVVLIGLLLNLVQVVLTQWDLSLTFRDGGFRRSAGLISRTSRSTNVDRVQALRWKQNPLERRLGIRRVHLPVIGEGDLQLPGTDDEELAVLRRLVLSEDARVDERARRIAPAQILRDTRTAMVMASISIVAAWVVVGAWACLFLVVVPMRFALTRRLVANARWGVNATGVARSDEVITESSNEIVLRKINGVEVRQSFFERSRELATVRLRTAEGGLSIGMIPVAEARAVRDHVLHAIATDARPWM